MKKSKIFYIIGGLSFVPVAIGIGLMAGFAQNYNEYNIIKSQINLMEKVAVETSGQKVTEEMKAMTFHAAMSSHFENLNKDNVWKKQEQEKWNNAYNKIKLIPNIDKDVLEIFKLQTELKYVAPQQEEFVSGIVLLSIGLAESIALFSIAIVFNKKEKLEKQNNLENNLPQNNE